MSASARRIFVIAAMWIAAQAAACGAESPTCFGESFVRKRAWVLDHGLRPKAYPKYLGKALGLGWQGLYNQDEKGAYVLERELEFRNTRLDLRITQAYVGDAAHPTGRLALRYPKGGPVTPTQPEWYSTWCRYDDSCPGMLDVAIGDRGLEGVAPEFEYGTDGAIAFVRCRWQYEKGSVVATFLMLPDDDRLFCEVGVTPKIKGERIAVSLCCWPLAQFVVRTATKTSPPLKYDEAYRLPAADPTVLFTDPAFDPIGKTAFGTCAMTYFPDECSSVTVLRKSPVFVTLNLLSPKDKSCAYAHFVLWELLHRRGDEAFTYVAGKEAETLDRFAAMNGIADPRLTGQREKGIKEVRDRLSALKDAAASGPEPVAPEPVAPAEASLNRRWGAFYRDEAIYHLASGDWRGASHAVDRASRFLSGRGSKRPPSTAP